jgi:HD-GYP domain-containing protein (c-di-GMP phosphodiesterase class II)
MSEKHPSLLMTSEASFAAKAVPPEIVPEHRRTFHSTSEIPVHLDNSVLVLTPAQASPLLAEKNNASYVVVLWRSDEAQPIAPALLNHPQVVGVLDRHCSSETVYATLRSALTLLVRRGEQRSSQMLEHVLEIGRALASEKDLDTLLGLILRDARRLTGADGASIYTREAQGSASVPYRDVPMTRAQDAQERPAGVRTTGAADSSGKLYFRLWQNASTGTTSNAQKTLVGDYSIAGYVAREGNPVMLSDAYAIPSTAPYKFNPASDRSIGYHTKSLLTVPLKNKADEVVGVLQLINRKDRPDLMLTEPADFEKHVLSFDEHDQSVALALAGQAGVALENSMLYADIERLFEGFIKASVQAIEARDPTTAGHSFRVADFTERLALAVDRSDDAELRRICFTKEQLRELRYASLLHDFGKVGVRENVLVKAKKLYPEQLDLLRQRFRYARASLERRAFRRMVELHDTRGLSPAEFLARRREIEQGLLADQTRLDEYLQLVLRANEPSVSHAEISEDLDAVAAFTFPGEEDEVLPLLHDFEFANLALAKGSLNTEERSEIESHVSHTYAFLSLIPWTRNLANLPNIAFAHHEKVDGTGYPRKLGGADIPVQSRMMTISDIYDALTAGDRPYKRGLSTDKALDILTAEARGGKIDPLLFKIFVECGAWRLAG